MDENSCMDIERDNMKIQKPRKTKQFENNMLPKNGLKTPHNYKITAEMCNLLIVFCITNTQIYNNT